MDFSDMSPAEPGGAVAERCESSCNPQPQPWRRAWSKRRERAGPSCQVRYDPTGAEVHPRPRRAILVLDRFQRMGHHVVFIVGDVTPR